MRKMIFILSILSMILSTHQVSAGMVQEFQHSKAIMPHDSSKMRKSGMGMMQMQGTMPMMHEGKMGMMHAEEKMCTGMDILLKRALPVIHLLPQLKEELGLSKQQADQLEELQTDYQKFYIDQQSKIKKANIDLKLLVEKNASSKIIRPLIEKISKFSIENELKAYEMANAMLKLLKPEQKEKWQEHQLEYMKSCCTMQKKMLKEGMHSK